MFTVTENDPRWVLSTSDPLGSHPWYQSQPLDKRVAIGMWRQANMAKVGTQFEGILVRGLLHYAFWVPNGSPEYRYCVHESIEECSHSLMFQEIVNRIGDDVPGMPRWLRVLSPLVPFYAGPFPNAFFFGVLAGEVPFDYLQTNLLRERRTAVDTSDHAGPDRDSRRRRGPAHLLRARIPAPAGAASGVVHPILVVVVRADRDADVGAGDGSAATPVVPEVRHSPFGAQGAISRRHRIRGRRCATCSAISECCAANWG